MSEKEYISRESAIGAIIWNVSEIMNRSQAESVLRDVPVADVVERKHGEWITRPWDSYYFRCSVCGGEVGTKWPFCHHCGADMREGDNG